jgi:hypothetical protein
MGIKRKLAAAAVAIASVTGITLATAVPAEAVNMSRVAKCVWPGKATFDLWGDSSSYGYSWRAYSETGYYLGSHWGQNWYTPWEDVTVFITSSDPSYSITYYCR